MYKSLKSCNSIHHPNFPQKSLFNFSVLFIRFLRSSFSIDWWYTTWFASGIFWGFWPWFAAALWSRCAMWPRSWPGLRLAPAALWTAPAATPGTGFTARFGSSAVTPRPWPPPAAAPWTTSAVTAGSGPSGSAATPSAPLGSIFDQSDTAAIYFCVIKFVEGILHVRVCRKLHNSLIFPLFVCISVCDLSRLAHVILQVLPANSGR